MSRDFNLVCPNFWLLIASISCIANTAHFQLINATDLICGEKHYGLERSQGMIEHHDIMYEEHPVKELT